MKTVLITGGARGIGKCIAENLAKDGYNIILNYNKSEKQAKQIKEDLEAQGKVIEIFKADVSKKSEVEKLVKYALKKFKDIDILINNAGIQKIQMFQDIKEEDWDEVINTNLKSAFYCIQEILPNMIKNKSGCIINISSVWGMVGASCETLYSISKAGMDAMTKSLAKELGPSNIRVNSIAPGIIDTDMNKLLNNNDLEKIRNEIPLERIGLPQDIARCAKWLIEEEYTTGQVISPNGGWVIN